MTPNNAFERTVDDRGFVNQRRTAVQRGTFDGTMTAPPEPTKSMTACHPRLTFTALNLADAKQPIARHEQPNCTQTRLRNECGPPLHELRR